MGVAQERIKPLAVGAARQVFAFAEGELAAGAVVGNGRLGAVGVLMPPLAPAAGAVSPRSVLARRAAECSSRNWSRARRRVVLRADGGDGLVAVRRGAQGARVVVRREWCGGRDAQRPQQASVESITERLQPSPTEITCRKCRLPLPFGGARRGLVAPRSTGVVVAEAKVAWLFVWSTEAKLFR